MKSYGTNTEGENGTITGRIIDNTSSQPVSFASVVLVNLNDTAIVSGVITDDNGLFQIKDIPFGKYKLRVSFIGYKTEWVNDIEVSRAQKTVALNDMKISEDVTTLNEAVVVEERLKGEEKIDRTVFTLNDEIRKSSSSGLAVLKHIPSVSVDFQENVSLEGQSNIQFYVDGVLRNKEFIAQLDPNLIDKVELITNPGVKIRCGYFGYYKCSSKENKQVWSKRIGKGSNS
ncbi:MAG: TonB-dependent receptor [Bacteroidales bacterium]|nr:TonB-dependent receptor [Bacteroidales bacterium]